MNKNILFGTAIIAGLILLACFAPLITHNDPLYINMNEKLQGISVAHIMGTDQLGRDIFSRVLYGARVSITASFSIVIICMSFGTLMGSIAGYFGGVTDEIIMRIVDIIMSTPSLILPIAITGLLGPSIANIILAMALTSWVGYARMMRSSVLAIKHLDFVEAAKAMGSTRRRVLLRHIIPNSIHPLVVYAAFNASHTILAFSGFSFIGLGAQPPTPEWGAMLKDAVTFIATSSNLFIFPGIMVMLTVLGFNLLGDGLRDMLDPRMKREIELTAQNAAYFPGCR